LEWGAGASSHEEKSKLGSWRQGLGSSSLNLALYYKGEFVGWCMVNQETAEAF